MWGPYAASHLVGGEQFKWYKSRGSRVLILGAGASKPFGFPIGGELLNRIRANVPQQHSPLHTALMEQKHTESRVAEFYQKLAAADVRSIDHFLDQTVQGDPDFTEIGRMAIATELFVDEIASARLLTQQNWYYELRELLVHSLRAKGPTVAIVTFNYDRSLVEFLKLFPVPQDSLPTGAAVLTDAIPILHVHGCLGSTDIEKSADSERLYGAEITPECLKQAAANIRVMHELDHNHGSAMNQAKNFIHNAERVIFVGFAYDTWNLERLRIVSGFSDLKWEGGPKCYGTCFKESAEKISQVESLSAGCLELASPHMDVCSFARNGLRERLLG